MSSWDTNPWSNFDDPHWELICHNKWHPGTLEISTPQEIAVGTHFHARHGTKTTHIFSYWCRSLLVATSNFGLLTIRPQSATRKHLFLYPQGDRPGLRKPKKDKHQHQSQLPAAFISLSQSNNNIRFSFNQPIRKSWVARPVSVIKHLPHKVFLLWQPH